MKTSFLHVADVHLDRPLDKIRRLDQRAAEKLHDASRSSLRTIVDEAIAREVGAVVIAGDLFDGPVRDASAALWTESQFKRLSHHKIPVVLIQGNHDAVSGAGRVCRWPAGVVELPAEQPDSVVLEQAGIVVHGQSFGARSESRDLAAKYPAAHPGFFNVGLLHTSLGGGAGSHQTYAPTSVSVLESAGYEYWALGHIHQRSLESLSQECYVGYSGNTQGCSIRECGPKGCQLVHVQDQRIDRVEFIATDSVRWIDFALDISALENLHDIEDHLAERLPELTADAHGRSVAMRLRLVGATQLYADLSRPHVVSELSDLLMHRIAEFEDFWLEKVAVDCCPMPEAHIDSVETAIEYLSRVASSCKTNDVVRQEVTASLDELLKKARSELSEYGWSITPEGKAESGSNATLNQYLARSENLVAARLMGRDTA